MTRIKKAKPPSTSFNNKKFEFTGRYQEIIGRRIWEIRRKRSNGKGALGGFIEQENNLDFEGLSWIGPEARVYGNAKIKEDASIYGNAMIGEEAEIGGRAHVYGEAWVYGTSRVDEDAQVYGHSIVTRDVHVGGKAKIYGKSIISGRTQVKGTAIIKSGEYFNGVYSEGTFDKVNIIKSI